eukprot:g68593.t1
MRTVGAGLGIRNVRNVREPSVREPSGAGLSCPGPTAAAANAGGLHAPQALCHPPRMGIAVLAPFVRMIICSGSCRRVLSRRDLACHMRPPEQLSALLLRPRSRPHLQARSTASTPRLSRLASTRPPAPAHAAPVTAVSALASPPVTPSSQPRVGRPRAYVSELSDTRRRQVEATRKYRRLQAVGRCLLSLDISDLQVKEYLLSGQGLKQFPETCATMVQSSSASGAVEAARLLLQQLPSQSTFRQAILGVMKVNMDWKEMETVFSAEEASRQHVNTGARTVRSMLDGTLPAGQRPELFTAGRPRGVLRDHYCELEKTAQRVYSEGTVP